MLCQVHRCVQMARRALARKITYDQARSYTRTYPNAMGVTSIAAINGSDSYDQRYAATREMLERPGKERSMRLYRRNVGTLAQIKKKLVKQGKGKKAIDFALISSGGHRIRSGAATKAKVVAEMKRLGVNMTEAKRVSPSTFGAAPAPRAPAKKKAAKKKVAKKKTTRRKKKATGRGVTVGSGRKPPKTKRAPRTRGKTKTSGRKKKVAKKKVAKKRAYKRKTAREKAALRTKRIRKAKRAYARPYRKAGRGKFTRAKAVVVSERGMPIRVKDTYYYVTKSGSLRKIPDYALAGYKTSRRAMKAMEEGGDPAALIEKRMGRIRTAREKAAARVGKRGSLLVPNRRGRGKPRALTYQEWEAMTAKRNKPKKKKLTKAQRSAIAKKAAKKRWAGHTKKGKKKPKRKRSRSLTVTVHSNRRRKARRNQPITQAAANRRRGRKARRTVRRRSYRRNAALVGSYGSQLKQALMLGAVITGGYIAHKALTKLLQNVAFKDTQYGGLISGAIVAAAGVPLAVKFAPGDAKLVSAGMMVSLVHTAVMEVVSKFDKEGKIAPYLAGLGPGYGNRPGRPYGPGIGMGSYYEFYPHQVFNGMGEYVANQPTQMREASAGLGRLMQAPAGVGEYIGTDVSGIGEYEQVTPEYTRPVPTDEGIHPDLSTAERALSVAEAAAGVSGIENVPAMSTVKPFEHPVPVPDEPGGARAGSFAGRDGIFG